MEAHMGVFSSSTYDQQSEEDMDVRKGPWTVEEDSLLMNYVTIHGEGRWNSVARCAGLKRTGKSCRLRWLNYLRPDVRRGNISLQEQLMILELHSRWGNRLLYINHNSDAMRYVWMPRLLERIQATTHSSTGQPTSNVTTNTTESTSTHADIYTSQVYNSTESGSEPSFMPELSVASWDSVDAHVSPASDTNLDNSQNWSEFCPDNMSGSGSWDWSKPGLDIHGFETQNNNEWLGGDESLESLWNDENIWF
ncbi:hypothetical protein Patl1_00834 [Pistacia atlantica]|uniref:Uncharacterized protein n=1 Tax=Pistacia atlantica TaxID=434234 RepID=A0ACC1CB35_9ROSI|nr:hypothetical protein Patl1_00834 [Pistacia atlantica]